jgi:hypothetical protein
MATASANAENIGVKWVQADVLDWKSADSFDLILDSGCLHGIGSGKLARYKQQLLSWLLRAAITCWPISEGDTSSIGGL